MKVAFRTDASLQIGIGHVMRCLTLADTLRAAGAQCHFICREHQGHLALHIRGRGFTVSMLPALTELPNTPSIENIGHSKYAAWLGVDWSTDVVQTKVELYEIAFDWLIVDHYALDSRWEQALRPLCRKLMAIDDLADRSHDCDLLLDQNLGRDVGNYRELVPRGCIILAGPQFALLRPEFTRLRADSLHRRVIPRLRHLLISMGGVDQFDATGKVLEALSGCPLPSDMCITVVLGPHSPWLERVKSLARQMQCPTTVKVNVSNMADLMADSDLAIGGAGGTSWERCCLGLPSVVVVLADNQREGAAALEHSGSAHVLNPSEINTGKFVSILNRLLTTDALVQLSQKSSFVTDGRGVERVLRELYDFNG